MVLSRKQCHEANEIIQFNDHALDPLVFREALVAWGEKNFRPFAWRMTRDPYLILVAEIMLHRTQAIQVVPVYESFVKRYPTLVTLKQAHKKDVQKLLYPLGLRWRIDMMHKMTGELEARFGDQVPGRKEDLLSLSGVSRYIAGAVRCFAWNLPEPLIDTNTVRVVGRLFGLEIKQSLRRTSWFEKLAGALVDPDNPRSYNYAMLDLAEAVCSKKKRPNCRQCPVLEWCCYGRFF